MDDDRFGPKTFYADFRFANEVDAAPRDWLWPGRIPLGSLTLLVGDPGLGKSLLAADLAARVSAPQPWPDQPNPYPYPAGVVFASPEDSAAETVLPRLAAAGADLDHISLLAGVTRKPSYLHVHPSVAALYPPGYKFDDPARAEAAPLRLPDHADELEQAIRAHDHPRLVVLDPLAALLSPAAQGNPAPLLASLADIAHRKGLAILAIGHLAKGRSHRILYRLRGSLSFAAAARTVLLISADPDHPDRRVLSAVKMAYGPLPPPLAFRIASSATTPHDIRLCENRPRDNRSCKDRSCENPFSHADRSCENPFSHPDLEILDWRYAYPIAPSNSESSNARRSSPVSPAAAELARLQPSRPFPPAPHLIWEDRSCDNRSCENPFSHVTPTVVRSCENPFSHADPAPESDHLPPLGPSVPAPQSVIHNSPPLPRPSGNAPTSSTCRRKPIPPSPRPAPGSPTTSPPAPAPPATSSATPTPPASRTAHSSAPNNSSASAPSAPSTTASGAGTRPAPQHQSPSGSACHYPHLGAPSRPRRAP
jgi:hypothetical protein